MARQRKSVKETPARGSGKKPVNPPAEEETKFPPSIGGIWTQENDNGDVYYTGLVSSDRDKDTLSDILDEVYEDDAKAIKLLIFPNKFKNSERSPDHVLYAEVTERKQSKRRN